MIALDTNVLVRHLVQDDPAQTQQARTLIHTAISRGETIFIGLIVLFEIFWVLKKLYGFGKPQLVLALETLSQEPGFEIESRQQVHDAIENYRRGRADFPDCLIGHFSKLKGCTTTYTFDRRLRSSPHFTVLSK